VRRIGAHIHFRVRPIGAGAGLDRKLVLIEGNRALRICDVAVGKASTPTPEGEFQIANRIPETASNSRVEIRVMAPTLCLRTVNYISVKSLIRRQLPAGRLAALQSGVKNLNCELDQAIPRHIEETSRGR
jgi:hypothetical protein